MAKKNNEIYFDIDIDGLINKIGDELKNDVNVIRNDAPKKSGKYANGWKLIINKKNGTLTIVHDKKYRSLEHLLEFGHKLNTNGKKTNSKGEPKTLKVKGTPHIINNFEDIERKVENIINNYDLLKTK